MLDLINVFSIHGNSNFSSLRSWFQFHSSKNFWMYNISNLRNSQIFTQQIWAEFPKDTNTKGSILENTVAFGNAIRNFKNLSIIQSPLKELVPKWKTHQALFIRTSCKHSILHSAPTYNRPFKILGHQKLITT